jgi:hypothetical protein
MEDKDAEVIPKDIRFVFDVSKEQKQQKKLKRAEAIEKQKAIQSAAEEANVCSNNNEYQLNAILIVYSPGKNEFHGSLLLCRERFLASCAFLCA